MEVRCILLLTILGYLLDSRAIGICGAAKMGGIFAAHVRQSVRADGVELVPADLVTSLAVLHCEVVSAQYSPCRSRAG